MKHITIQLTGRSIDAAIKELEAYKAKLNDKVQELIDRMIEYGEDYALNAVGHVDTGTTLTTVMGYRNGDKGVIVAGGAAVFLEFGVGVRHNTPKGTSPHPKGQELGFTIGDYGKGKGADPQGWWYYDGSEVKHTSGIAANMFMYRTAQELARVAPELAKEVFAT